MQCSIIGTCLSDQDLISMIRKHKLQVARDAQSYDIHSYCVRAAGQRSPFSRALTKLLDGRFAGVIRMLGRAASDEEVWSLWERLRDNGQVAAAYWAVMSNTHISDPVKVRVFGQVHMLSHLHGHSANQLALRLAEAERKNAHLEARLRRSEQAKLDALAERDAARAALVISPVGAVPAGGMLSPPSKSDEARLRLKLAKRERALLSARVRARQAEQGIARVAGQLASIEAKPKAPQAKMVAAVRRNVALPQRVLYLGGRPALLPHLREVAAIRVAAFLHHDGGIEDSLHRSRRWCSSLRCSGLSGRLRQPRGLSHGQVCMPATQQALPAHRLGEPQRL